MSQKTLPQNANGRYIGNEYHLRRSTRNQIEKLENRRDRQINELNREIYILLGEINEQMIYEVQQANNQHVQVGNLFSQLERNFSYTVKSDSYEINMPEAVSGYIQNRLNEIADKQARIEKVKVQTQIARQALDEMVTFND